mgnify:CR=1 FL=1
MVWWAWLVVGLLLRCAEMLRVDAAVYLVFLGVAAILTGTIGLVGIGLPVAAQWMIFSALAAISMVFFRRKVYLKLRGSPIGFEDQVDGRHVVVTEDVGAGGQTRVEFRGSRWVAVNVGNAPLTAGDQAIITKASGSRLEISSL